MTITSKSTQNMEYVYEQQSYCGSYLNQPRYIYIYIYFNTKKNVASVVKMFLNDPSPNPCIKQLDIPDDSFKG